MVHLNLRNIVYTRKQKHISQLSVEVLVSAYIQYMGMQSYLISTQQDYHHMSAKIRLEGHIWIFYDVILKASNLKKNRHEYDRRNHRKVMFLQICAVGHVCIPTAWSAYADLCALIDSTATFIMTL